MFGHKKAPTPTPPTIPVIITVEAGEGNIQRISVQAVTPEVTLALFRQIKQDCKLK